MISRLTAFGLALSILPSLGSPASADDAFTLDCRVTQIEKIDSGSPTSNAHAFVASFDLSARKFYVFEDTSRKYRSDRIESIRAMDANALQLTAPSDFRHGTEHVTGSGLRLELRTMALTDTTVLKDGRTTIETTWNGACAKVPFRPLPAK